MRSAISIVTYETYQDFAHQQSRKILNKNIWFKDCFDVAAFGMTNSFTYPNAEVVYFTNCDKNFPYSIYRPTILPKVRVAVFGSHPGSGLIFDRIPNVQLWVNVDFYFTVDENISKNVLIPTTLEGIKHSLANNYYEKPLYFDNIPYQGVSRKGVSRKQ